MICWGFTTKRVLFRFCDHISDFTTNESGRKWSRGRRISFTFVRQMMLMRDWKYLFYSRHIHVICLPPYCQKFTSLLVILKNLHSDWNSSRKKWKIEEQRPFHKATARLALYFFVLEIISLCFFLILSTCINECKSSSLPYPDRWLVARLVSLLAIGCRYRPHEYGHKSNGEVRTTTGTNRVASEE